MILHNESGKWLRWSEQQARIAFKRGGLDQILIYTFPQQDMQCVWFN